MHEVIITLLDGVQPLDVVGPFEVLAGATLLGAGGGYRLRLVAAEAGPIVADSGLVLTAGERLPDAGHIDTLLVPGGHSFRRVRPDDAFTDWLGRAADRADRVVSVCTGAFALAAAGLLDGLAATTHWAYTAELAQRYPAVDVKGDAVFLRAGRIWTSAGVTAGIDLTLALVEADHGAELATEIARQLVVFVRRPGGQSQFAAPVWHPPAQRPAVRAAQDLIHAEPAADLRIPVLAARVGMSERHFSREFTRLLGCSPADYVEGIRVDAARRMLESESVLISVAAIRSGFGSPETMRRAFLRRLGVPPTSTGATSPPAPPDRCASPIDASSIPKGPAMQIAIALYPRLTALDAIGPYDVLQRVPSLDVVFVGSERGEVRTDNGFLGLTADAAYDEVRSPDVVLIPGGIGTREQLGGGPLTDWLLAVHPATQYTTSVCSGALILAAAGLLDGLTATTHWGVLDMLATWGATGVTERVVEHLDRRIITAAGVSAGIDMGIRLVELLVDDVAAQAAQVYIEYDPQPPFDAGHPAKVGPEVMARVAEYSALRP